MRDGGADVDGLRIIGGGDPEPHALVHRRDGRYGADIGDDTCEHQGALSYSWQWSGPNASLRSRRKPGGISERVTGDSMPCQPRPASLSKRRIRSTRPESRKD